MKTDEPPEAARIDRERSGTEVAVSTAASTQLSDRSAEIGSTEFIPLLEERLSVDKRRVAMGKVTVRTRTEVHDEVAEVALNRHKVDVTRVAVGEIVEAHPQVRTEGDTTIVPVVEERFVVVKQLYLKEELHIRHIVDREVVQTTVPLRRQRAVVERVNPDGTAVVPIDPSED